MTSHYPLVSALQADAVATQATPTSGTLYDVFALAGLSSEQQNIEIISVIAKVTWTVQPTPLQLHITIDGITYIFSQANPVSTQNYYPMHSPVDAVGSQPWMLLTGSSTNDIRNTTAMGPLLKGDIKIEMETTGGTVQSIDCRVRYRQW